MYNVLEMEEKGNLTLCTPRQKQDNQWEWSDPKTTNKISDFFVTEGRAEGFYYKLKSISVQYSSLTLTQNPWLRWDSAK